MSEARKGCTTRLGCKHTPEAKAKMSIARKKRVTTDETRAKLSAAGKGRSPAIKGKHHSEETKRKISTANTGRITSAETIEKIRVSKLAMSDETKALMSESRKKWWANRKAQNG